MFERGCEIEHHPLFDRHDQRAADLVPLGFTTGTLDGDGVAIAVAHYSRHRDRRERH